MVFTYTKKFRYLARQVALEPRRTGFAKMHPPSELCLQLVSFREDEGKDVVEETREERSRPGSAAGGLGGVPERRKST